MAFIVQCPHRDCRKFMLLEDHLRGTQVECLICERTIALEPSASEERRKPPPLKKAAASASPSAKRLATLVLTARRKHGRAGKAGW